MECGVCLLVPFGMWIWCVMIYMVEKLGTHGGIIVIDAHEFPMRMRIGVSDGREVCRIVIGCR